MTRRFDLPLVLLAVSLFLAPLIGGQVSLDAAPGVGGLMDVLLGGPEAPLLTHALLAIPVAVSFALLVRRQVVQVPNSTVTTTLFLFFGMLVASVVISAFKFNSIAAAAEWVAYAIAFLATVGAAGRQVGPRLLIGAIFVGTVLLAMRGILEYGEMKSVDPSWRIFAGWVNPNATAAMLLVGFFLGLAQLGLARERLVALLSGLGVALIGLALALTQSKGALLVLAAGLVVFAVVASTIGGQVRKTAIVRLLGAIAVVGVLAFATQQRAGPPATMGGTSGALARVASAQSTSEQSAGFRTLLWKGAGNMVRKNPTGFGIGTYRFESGRSGLHTQTVFTHQAYLQLATEGSPFLALLLLISGALWVRLVFRGWGRLPAERKLLQAGVFSAVSAIAMHSAIDSDLYYFGVGLAFFALIGLGLLLSGDAVAPEYAPPPLRAVGLLSSATVVLALCYVGAAEFQRAQARALIATRDVQAAGTVLASLRGFAPMDGEAWALSAQVASTTGERIEAAKRAAEIAPSTRNLRRLARLQSEANEVMPAITSLNAALYRDPNNLPALAQLADLYERNGSQADAEATRRRMVAIEQTPVFQIRSLPELVPTDTYVARIHLARGKAPREQISLLQPAVDGFGQYLAKTVPTVKRFASGEGAMDFGGESLDTVRQKLEVAADAARQLAAAYRAAGDPGRAEAAEAAAGAFAAGFDK